MDFPERPSRMLRLLSSTSTSAPADIGYERRARGLAFEEALEARFERETRVRRSTRLWREGLISIAAFVVFYSAEWLFTGQVPRGELLVELGVIAPCALAVNLLVYFNPPRVLREGSVALMSCVIGCTYLWMQEGKEPVAIAYAAVGAIVTALFASAVMRLRFRYALAVSVVLATATLRFLACESGLRLDQKLTGSALTLVAIAIGMMANYDTEWEERLSYLRHLDNERHRRELATVNVRLAELSATDSLTGLPNRRGYEERFAAMWAWAEQEGLPLSMVVLDVDHFKVINDVFGHVYGDDVLRRVGSLLKESLRSHQDCVARYGGEEFVVLLPGADCTVAAAVAERIRRMVEVAASPTQGDLHHQCLTWVTVSCGYATCADASRALQDGLLRAADEAMYAAKNAGRNRTAEGVIGSRFMRDRDNGSARRGTKMEAAQCVVNGMTIELLGAGSRS